MPLRLDAGCLFYSRFSVIDVRPPPKIRYNYKLGESAVRDLARVLFVQSCLYENFGFWMLPNRALASEFVYSPWKNPANFFPALN